MWSRYFAQKKDAVRTVRQRLREAQASFARSLEIMRAERKESSWEDQLDVRAPPDDWDDAAADAWWEAHRQLRRKREGK